jgi:hypothetical protein
LHFPGRASPPRREAGGAGKHGIAEFTSTKFPNDTTR